MCNTCPRTMEFRVDSATGGEIIEGVYIDSEAASARTWRRRACSSSRSSRKAAWPGTSRAGRRRGEADQEFLVFNQELATLLKAGMPLVQSLDILRQRVTNPTFKAVSTRPRQGSRPGRRCRTPSPQPGRCSPGLFRVAAGGRAQRQPGAGAPALRRLRKGHRGGPAEDHVGADLPGDPRRHDARPGGIIVLQGGAGFSDFYASFGNELPLSTRIIVASRTSLVAELLVHPRGAGPCGGVRGCGSRGQRTAMLDRMLLELPWVGHGEGSSRRRSALGPGDAARRRHPAGQCARHSARSMSAITLKRPARRSSPGVIEGQSSGALAARGSSPTWPSRWWKWASPRARSRRC